MTAPISGNRPAATASTSSSGMSQSDAKAYVDSLMNQDSASRKKVLGDSRYATMNSKITSDMNAYLAANPNASKADIEAKYKDSSSKAYGYEFSNKLRDDAFLGRLKQFMKEALADRWEE
jgi:hypothetical protein